MKEENNLLLEGIKALRKSDEEIENLIAPHYEKVISLLNRYIDEIELFNPAYGLVGAKDTNELIIKHILDSIAPLGIISRLLDKTLISKNIADAGSGAGLPGIPLAIVLNQYNFSLIERMGRRVGFLLNTKAALALQNVNIEESEVEKASCGRFNLVTFRAFKPLDEKLLKTLFGLCIPGGIIAAYKGKSEKIKAEMSPLEMFCDKWEAIPYTVPFLEEERHLLIIWQKK